MIQALSGSEVIPAMWTRRVASSITTSTTLARQTRRHTHHQLPNLGDRRRPSGSAALMAVVLPRDEMPMPGEEGVGAHDRLELLEHAASQAFRLGRQSNALIVGEPETARTELLSKDAIFSLEIIDHLALLLVDPAGQGDEQKPQRV